VCVCLCVLITCSVFEVNPPLGVAVLTPQQPVGLTARAGTLAVGLVEEEEVEGRPS